MDENQSFLQIGFSINIPRQKHLVHVVLWLRNMFSPSEDQCLICDFTIKVNENQIDATFIALEIYLKLSNKWTKESALQDWFLQRQWIMGNKIFE